MKNIFTLVLLFSNICFAETFTVGQELFIEISTTRLELTDAYGDYVNKTTTKLEKLYVHEVKGDTLVLRNTQNYSGTTTLTQVNTTDPNIKIVGSTPVTGRSLVYTMPDGTIGISDRVVSRHGNHRVMLSSEGRPYILDTNQIKVLDRGFKTSGGRVQILTTAALAAVALIATQAQPSAASDASALTNSEVEVPQSAISQ